MTAAPQTQTPQTQIAEEDRLRADLYGFLSSFLSAPPSRDLLDQTAGLTGDDSELGNAIKSLANVARVTSPKAAEREFNALFIGLGRGELLPYASFYLTGFLNEKPLALLRRDMAAQGITRAPNIYEPEDNIASLLEMTAGLITGAFGTPAPVSVQRTFWNKHVGPWVGHFFGDLESANSSVLYASVGTIGRVFIDIEREAFRISDAG